MARKMLKEERAVADKFRYYRQALPVRGGWDEPTCKREDNKLLRALIHAVREDCAKVAEGVVEPYSKRTIAAALRGVK